jgi:2',3'-cyclic-nucleotide 2'-phosphodiesterase (5'-nucleotidase family)
LFLDSGSLLFKQKEFSPDKAPQVKTKAEGIAKAMRAMDCRAMGVSAYDLSCGVDLLKEIQENYKINWLSINLVDPETKKPIFTPYLIAEIDDMKVAVLGLTDERAEQSAEAKKRGYTILHWQEVLPEVVAKLAKQVDMTILLSNYPYQVNKEIAEKVTGIHLILASGHTASSPDPYKIENTLIAQTGTRGKYLGTMRIDWTAAKIWKETSRANQPKTEKMCGFKNRFIALESSSPQEPKVQEIISATVQEINLLNKKKVNSSKNQPTATLQDLSGWQKCQECHQEQVAFWEKTQHADAWPTLKKKNQHFNEECLLCHVTLPYYDAAKVQAERLLLMLPKELKNVGCETCHGPGANHVSKREAIPVPHPDKKICKLCHTPEHDDNFVFADKVERIRCPKNEESEN